jgi:hypothetical protein
MASRPELKEEDESSFCKFFRNLPQKNADTVRIFDRGDYYSAHGEDAKFIASTVRLRLREDVWGCSFADTTRSIGPRPLSASLVGSQASNPSP